MAAYYFFSIYGTLRARDNKRKVVWDLEWREMVLLKCVGKIVFLKVYRYVWKIVEFGLLNYFVRFDNKEVSEYKFGNGECGIHNSKLCFCSSYKMNNHKTKQLFLQIKLYILSFHI